MRGLNWAVQILYKDIFSLVWYMDRRILSDTASLDCLFPREWTDPGAERHDAQATSLPVFEDALRSYHKRTSNGDLYDSYSYIDDLRGKRIDYRSETGMKLEERVNRLWKYSR